MALFRLKKEGEDKGKNSSEAVVSIPSADGIAPGGDVKKPEKVKNIDKSAEKKTDKKTSSDVLSLNYRKDTASILKNPRVTEKATIMSEKGVYVFDVSARATKADVRDAVKELYKVTPRKINMVKVPSKRTRVRGQQNRFGVKSGGKKAYVYVKKGDTIDIV